MSSPAVQAAPNNKAVSPVVNDVTIHVATLNGTGSQTSNNVLMRAIFEMGIPVSGKNIFPSNVAGLPTWFTIRANRHGFIGMKREPDILVAMNQQTADDDLKALQPGALCFHDSALVFSHKRTDVEYIGLPFAQITATVPGVEVRFRKMLANMCCIGALAELLHLDCSKIESAIRKHFNHKPKPIETNVAAVNAGALYVRENVPPFERFRLEPMRANDNKVIIDGNSALAIGAMMGGATVLGWYPITPASTVCETFIALTKEYRHDPVSGKATYANVQCEDELSSLGVVMGAAWAGARAFTATSGPGLSLMAELAGLAYYTEIPTVIFDVQRVGPSTGLPTRTMQGDLLQAAYLSHGDTKHILLFPNSIEECYQHAQDAFDLAEQFQTVVMVLSDMDLGMNLWVSDIFPYPRQPLQRGKVLNAQQLEELKAKGQTFGRYRDVDGDGVPYRTVPGTDHPLAAYFLRGTGHDDKALYNEKPEVFTANMDRLTLKLDTARHSVPPPVVSGDESAEVGLIAYGSSDLIMTEVLDQLRQRGISAQYLRIRGFPFAPAVSEFVARKKRVYIVDQNRDGQMRQLLRLELAPELDAKMRGVRHYDGWPIDARTVVEQVLQQEQV